MVPKIKYIINEKGKPVSVQIAIKEWKLFLKDYQRVSNQSALKKNLKQALKEAKEMQQNNLNPQTLSQFLNEL